MPRFVFTFLLMVIAWTATAAIAPAELIYYTEDFEENGAAGFDPMFHHEFFADPGVQVLWFLYRSVESSHYGEYGLALGNGTTDVITFNLPAYASVAYASVAIHDGLGPETSVRFAGSEDVWQSGVANWGQKFVEISWDDIGSIQQVELYSTQGGFYDVRIGVVPEPTCLLSLAALTSTALALVPFIRGRRSH